MKFIALHTDSIEVEVYEPNFELVGACEPCGGTGKRPAAEVTGWILGGDYPCPACSGSGKNYKRHPDKRTKVHLALVKPQNVY